jgi:hypothetical protein
VLETTARELLANKETQRRFLGIGAVDGLQDSTPIQHS